MWWATKNEVRRLERRIRGLEQRDREMAWTRIMESVNHYPVNTDYYAAYLAHLKRDPNPNAPLPISPFD